MTPKLTRRHFLVSSTAAAATAGMDASAPLNALASLGGEAAAEGALASPSPLPVVSDTLTYLFQTSLVDMYRLPAWSLFFRKDAHPLLTREAGSECTEAILRYIRSPNPKDRPAFLEYAQQMDEEAFGFEKEIGEAVTRDGWDHYHQQVTKLAPQILKTYHALAEEEKYPYLLRIAQQLYDPSSYHTIEEQVLGSLEISGAKPEDVLTFLEKVSDADFLPGLLERHQRSADEFCPRLMGALRQYGNGLSGHDWKILHDHNRSLTPELQDYISEQYNPLRKAKIALKKEHCRIEPVGNAMPHRAYSTFLLTGKGDSREEKAASLQHTLSELRTFYPTTSLQIENASAPGTTMTRIRVNDPDAAEDIGKLAIRRQPRLLDL